MKKFSFFVIQTLHNDCSQSKDVHWQRRSKAEFGHVLLSVRGHSKTYRIYRVKFIFLQEFYVCSLLCAIATSILSCLLNCLGRKR